MNILLTGYAGFIGFHLALKLINDKSIKNIYGIDDLNNYYDVNLKKNRIKILRKLNYNKKLKEFKFNIKNYNKLFNTFHKTKIDVVINLAAQAGVRYSFINPKSYIDSNIIGFFNILELIKEKKIPKLVFASTSSSYGSQSLTPYKENLMNNTPLQLYAATKISNEVMAHSYSHLYGLTSIGLRFFTVYGPYGRPDMAIYKFTDSIYNNKKIDLYDSGKMLRDCTYVDDIVEGIMKTLKINNSSSVNTKHNIYNIGFGKPVTIRSILDQIELNSDRKASIKILPKHASEMNKTYCSTVKFNKDFNFKPKININDGLKKFNDWYKSYHLR
ncbi:NAD-dependent epimerase/dehydratase family protein [Alphaproteobacteria bacterium]|nr:NAD-dependent epimerase/dehydratase family protein [Alphaproteobacteria bacterium]